MGCLCFSDLNTAILFQSVHSIPPQQEAAIRGVFRGRCTGFP